MVITWMTVVTRYSLPPKAKQNSLGLCVRRVETVERGEEDKGLEKGEGKGNGLEQVGLASKSKQLASLPPSLSRPIALFSSSFLLLWTRL